MEITYQGHKKRSQRAHDLWLRIATDFNAGMSAKDIASRYTNPITKRPYTREHIYLVLRKIKTETI